MVWALISRLNDILALIGLFTVLKWTVLGTRKITQLLNRNP